MTIKPQTVSGHPRWRVTWRAGGRCFRRFFPTREQAQAFASSTKTDLRELGNAWGALTQGERSELVDITSLLVLPDFLISTSTISATIFDG
jgi:hypothetical protein